MATLVAVNPASAGRTVAVLEADWPLEHVGLVFGRVGLFHPEQFAEFDHEALGGGELACCDPLAAPSEFTQISFICQYFIRVIRVF